MLWASKDKTFTDRISDFYSVDFPQTLKFPQELKKSRRKVKSSKLNGLSFVNLKDNCKRNADKGSLASKVSDGSSSSIKGSLCDILVNNMWFLVNWS